MEVEILSKTLYNVKLVFWMSKIVYDIENLHFENCLQNHLSNDDHLRYFLHHKALRVDQSISYLENPLMVAKKLKIKQ